MTRKQHRLVLILVSGLVLAIAVTLSLVALKDQIVFFKTPSDLQVDKVDDMVRFRLGGLVKEDSFIKSEGTKVLFSITDSSHDIAVEYDGILPDLFREGQGVVTEGFLKNNVFIADVVLAKHDETYMPREVAEALKEQGVWQGDKSVDDAVKKQGESPDHSYKMDSSEDTEKPKNDGLKSTPHSLIEQSSSGDPS